MTTHEDVRDRQERAAKNQSLIREVNERIKVRQRSVPGLHVGSESVCECANDTCTERIEMTTQEYEQIRSEGERFLVVPSDKRVWPDVERVVDRHATFWIVAKIEVAAEIAKGAHPRSDDPLSLQT